jgi:hypothetical protein
MGWANSCHKNYTLLCALLPPYFAILSIVTGRFLFTHFGYGADLQPHLTLLPEEGQELTYWQPRKNNFTLRFTTDTRYCCGWHDLASGKSFACPDSATLSKEFSQCMHCQRKTGFNPAFYHAASVSPQQQERNAQPHFLYLAHFAPGVVKVGISWSGRGIRRLLDQGARSFLIIKEYSNANVARQYEAKIAALPGIAETLQAKTKYTLLARPYDTQAGGQELLTVRSRLQQELGLQTDNNVPQHPHPYYLADNSFIPHELIRLEDGCISGQCLGMIGSALVVKQNNVPYFISLNSLVGYRLEINDVIQPNSHKPQQASLF